MKFSIVVPIYRVEAFLQQCIESVLEQTYQDWECILVDDGSPDRCPHLCDEYATKDNRIRVVHKVNGGLVSARQAGTEVAQGNYMVCLDGDDWLAPDCLEKFAGAIDLYKPDVICCGKIDAKPDSHKNSPITGYRTEYYSRDDIDNEIMPSLVESEYCQSFPTSIWAKAYKMDLYREEQMAVSPQIKIGEDICVTKPFIAKACSMYVMQECLYYYRMNPDSMTKEKKPFNLDNYRWRYNHLEARMDTSVFDLHRQICRSTAHGLFNALVSQFYRKENVRKIRKDVLLALDEKIYKECIKQAKFKGPFIAKLMMLALKYRLTSLMWLYSKLK